MEEGVCELFICCIYGSWGQEHGKTGSGMNTLNSNEMLRLDIEIGLSRMEILLDYYRLLSAFLGLPLVSSALLGLWEPQPCSSPRHDGSACRGLPRHFTQGPGLPPAPSSDVGWATGHISSQNLWEVQTS